MSSVAVQRLPPWRVAHVEKEARVEESSEKLAGGEAVGKDLARVDAVEKEARVEVATTVTTTKPPTLKEWLNQQKEKKRALAEPAEKQDAKISVSGVDFDGGSETESDGESEYSDVASNVGSPLHLPGDALSGQVFTTQGTVENESDEIFMESIDVDHRVLPDEARLQVLEFLCPFSSIPKQLDAWLQRWAAAAGVESKSPPVFVPPSEVVADVRDLSALMQEILQLSFSEIDFATLVGGFDESDAPLDNANWKAWSSRLCGPAPPGLELPAKQQALVTGALTKGFVEQNQHRVTNFFCSLPQLCRKATQLSFKIQKYDIYVAKREDPKLRKQCPQLLQVVSAAQKVASAYRSRAMAGVRDMCTALTAGLESGGEPVEKNEAAGEEATEAAAVEEAAPQKLSKREKQQQSRAAAKRATKD